MTPQEKLNQYTDWLIGCYPERAENFIAVKAYIEANFDLTAEGIFSESNHDKFIELNELILTAIEAGTELPFAEQYNPNNTGRVWEALQAQDADEDYADIIGSISGCVKTCLEFHLIGE